MEASGRYRGGKADAKEPPFLSDSRHDRRSEILPTSRDGGKPAQSQLGCAGGNRSELTCSNKRKIRPTRLMRWGDCLRRRNLRLTLWSVFSFNFEFLLLVSNFKPRMPRDAGGYEDGHTITIVRRPRSIDAHSAACRDVARGERNGSEQNRHACKCEWIRWPHAVQQAGHQPRKR